MQIAREIGYSVSRLSPVTFIHLASHLRSGFIMQSINRFLYGPTAEERVRTWQQRLRTESRQLDREIRQVCGPNYSRLGVAH